MTPTLKKYPGWTLVGILATTQLMWWWIAPLTFKTMWGKNPLVAHIINEHTLTQEKSKFLTLGYYYPDLSYFSAIITGSEQPDKARMGGAIRAYYQKAADLLASSDATHFLLGFCEYYTGNVDAARAQYEESMGLNPSFFWSYYNLGVIYFKQGDFLKSAVTLNKAFSLKNEFTLVILHQNPFYQQIWRNIDNPAPILENNLSEGEQDAALLLADCLVKAGLYDQALAIIQHFEKSGPWHRELWERLHKKALSRQSAMDDIDYLIKEQIAVRLF